jgi:hypothetical protein
VSKKRVDKAAAVIGKLRTGEVLYFESEQTLDRYRERYLTPTHRSAFLSHQRDRYSF